MSAGSCAAHADWKRMYESAIKCAEGASKTADHLRDLLDQLAPDWRSPAAPGRRHRPTQRPRRLGRHHRTGELTLSESVPIAVTARDTKSGDHDTQTIVDDYCLVAAGTAEVTGIQVHANADGTATHVITVKGVRRG